MIILASRSGKADQFSATTLPWKHSKASHSDLWDQDFHLIRAELPALAMCTSRQLSKNEAFWSLATGSIFKPTTYKGKIFPYAVP